MSEPKYAGTKRKNNSQYTSYLANYLAAGKDWGGATYFGFEQGFIIRAYCPGLANCRAFKILDSQNQNIRGLQGLMRS